MKNSNRIDLKRVAKEARVSPATVSKVLNGHTDVSTATREKILRIAEKLNYRPDSVRRAAGQGKSAAERSYRIAVVSPRSLLISFDAFFAEILKGIAGEIRQHGYQLVYELSKEDRGVPSCIQDKTTDGVIVIGYQPEWNDKSTTVIPVVHIDQIPEGSIGDAILPDYSDGAMQAAASLIENGHRRIALLYGSTEHDSSCPASLFAGYSAGLSKQGVTIPSEWIFNTGNTLENSYQLSKKLLSLPAGSRPTALISNDTGAMGIYRAINEMNLKVGYDVSVAGCDGLPMGEYLTPSLSTIAVDPEQIGRESVQLLIQRISGKEISGRRVIYSPVKFVKRNSIGKI
jgi:LacI family transcriptional regulator